MLPVTNISSYKFAPLKDLKPLRESLRARCKNYGLKGTILLSEEGINLFVAGNRDKIDTLVSDIKKIKGLEDLAPKYSESDHQPFTRMLVKIKKEIIAFGVESVKPGVHTSPKLKAQELKKWLDEGKEVVLLDTRNDYEVKMGTFTKALPIGIENFRDFPEAVRKLPEEMKEKPIVMFCTGGIRCEKAGPFMEQEGFKNIYQLDGGILKYFEEVGGAHYQGGCFVFDQRVGVDPTLLETDDKQCFICLSPLTLEDQKDSRYVAGKTCPHCFKTPEEKRKESIALHEKKIKEIANPLPGKVPYLNHRPLKIPQKYNQYKFIDFVSEVFPRWTKEFWLEQFQIGHFLDNAKNVVNANQIIKAGERYIHLAPQTSEPDVNAEIKILYEDEAILVIDKPAPLPVHPSGRFNRNTLQWILNEAYFPTIPRPAHRLDANTTGVIIFSRSKHFASLLQPQFERGEVSKTYLAKVHGHPNKDFFSCDKPIVNETVEVGARKVGEVGLAAFTEFKVLKRNEDGTSLLEVYPKTGRTNQIRVHLWSLGFPIVGDATYIADQKIGIKQSLSIEDLPMCLHAHKISFKHPLTKQQVEFSSPSKF